MKKFSYKPAMLALAAGMFLASCDPEIEVPTASAGEVDFSTYIAVGNSLTAGYGDGGLYREGQLNSYPAILAKQFELVGGGEFNQPLFSEDQANGSGYLRLAGLTADGTPVTANVTENRAIRDASGLLTKYLNPVQNLGIPGIRVADITTAGYGSVQGNPFFERITPDNMPGQTYLQRVQATNHTFFSLWLGNNDVLGYATSAGAFPTGSNGITPVNTFDARYSDMVNALTANGQKGILATIPDATTVPFFTTAGARVRQVLSLNPAITRLFAITGAGSNRIEFTPAQINAPNGVLFPLTAAPYAQVVGQPTGLYWRELAKQVSPSQNALVIRATLAALLANYQIDTLQMFALSDRNPLPSALVLDATERANVVAATNAYNTIIKAVANAKGLALFDAEAYFKSIAPGFSRDGVAYSPAFITGNLFSLDGVHPTPRGYAFVANEMIKAVNSKYGSRIPTVDETQYRAVLLP